ncbi:ABC transporter [Mesorhizobium loti]|uniref:ABC transporter n=1 Tax=Rhizobium loti TaxID=381 RepID=A0A101KSU3_RHILI|nr:ABC transporter [Mesorhizobium loti]
MARTALDDTDRMNIRVKPEVKARLLRAAALRHTDLTSFVTQSALREAENVIAASDAIKVSERDFNRILELLDNPPEPNAKLLAAAAALPKTL